MLEIEEWHKHAGGAMFRLNLRDLFWLALASACVTAWVIEHRAAAKAIEASAAKFPFLSQAKQPREPSGAEIERAKASERFALASDEELEQVLRAPTGDAPYDFEPCLVEMARRRLTTQLQKYHQEIYPPNGDTVWFARDLEVLTALRRAEGLPDPLKIHVQLDVDSWDKTGLSTWNLRAEIENVDAKQETVTFQRGGDYRGGRQERWRVVLTNPQVVPVEDSNFLIFIGGGISSSDALAVGEKSDMHALDIRAYVAPPPSGDYQLQIFYHNREGIAGEPDLSGLIVAKSDPIWVHVDNPPDGRLGLDQWQPLIVILIAMGTLAGVVLAQRWRSRSSANVAATSATHSERKTGVWRDVVWCVLVIVLASAWLVDQQLQTQRLVELKYHPEQQWTIRRIDEPSA
jgi:hypothetical protein